MGLLPITPSGLWEVDWLYMQADQRVDVRPVLGSETLGRSLSPHILIWKMGLMTSAPRWHVGVTFGLKLHGRMDILGVGVECVSGDSKGQGQQAEKSKSAVAGAW